MTKYFAAAFIAASALLAAASHDASAQTSPAPVRPAHNAHARGIHGPRRRARVVPAAYIQTAISRDSSTWTGESGKASYYGPRYHGRKSASGLRFDQMEMTAAHRWLPFGTRVRVALAGTDRSVIVTITDRIYSSRRVLDLSVAAARELGMIRQGVADVTIDPV